MKEINGNAWTIVDLVDFEALLLEDEKRAGDPNSAEDLHKRDRNIFLQIESESGSSDPMRQSSRSRHGVFWKWLKKRREERFRGDDTPGEEIVSWFRFWAAILFVLGFASAVGLVQSFYGVGTSAETASPVNVNWFTWVCIVPAFLITVFGFFFGFRGLTKGRLPRIPPFVRGFYRLLEPLLARKLKGVLSDSIGQDRELAINSAMGTVKAAAKSKREVLAASMFLWSQSFAIGFAIALPLLTLAHARWVSHDFTWGGNFAPAPEVFQRRVTLIATPWSWWLGEGRGYPSLEQVLETEYIKRDPLTKQPESAWEAWAMYLVLSSLFYVSLPRVLLWLVSWLRLRRALANPGLFEYARFDALHERMTLPYKSWGPEGKGTGGAPVDDPLSPEGLPEPRTKAERDVCILALSNEFDESVAEASRVFVRDHKHWEVTDILRFNSNVEGYKNLIEEASKRCEGAASRRFVMVEEAGMAPVIQFTNLIKDFRNGLGESTSIVVALLGDPSDDPLGEPSSPVQVEVWEKTLRALGDPRLRVITLWA